MQIGKIFDILGAIVGVAGITAVMGSPDSAAVIKAFGGAFSGSLSSALGK